MKKDKEYYEYKMLKKNASRGARKVAAEYRRKMKGELGIVLEETFLLGYFVAKSDFNIPTYIPKQLKENK